MKLEEGVQSGKCIAPKSFELQLKCGDQMSVPVPAKLTRSFEQDNRSQIIRDLIVQNPGFVHDLRGLIHQVVKSIDILKVYIFTSSTIRILHHDQILRFGRLNRYFT